MMLKSLFLLSLTLVFASGFVAPTAQRMARPFLVVADSSALFLHPEQAKDLEEFAHKLMLEASQRCSADVEKNNQAHGCKQRDGPVAWCRRVVQHWKHA
jgi:hypothetical protein